MLLDCLVKGTDDSIYANSWRTLKATIATRSQLPHTFRFLAAYFLYSDAVSTIATGSAVFAVAELHLSMQGIVLSLLEVALIATISGVAASLVRLVHRRCHILMCMCRSLL